jgi:beta-fructofuranosidase
MIQKKLLISAILIASVCHAQTPKIDKTPVSYVPETPAWPDTPPDNWPIYHLAHPTFTLGSPFDPNPALFYKGRYHLHYIYRIDAGYVFAHVSSKDMVHWQWHPTVLAPPTTGHGMFSGTGFFTKDGQPAMVYHGQGSNRNWIQTALDDDLNEWSEPQVMLPKDNHGNFVTNVPYFDPDIWLDGDTFYGINGVSSSKPPQIMKSDNLKDWTFIGDFLHPDFDENKLGVKKSEDISCPNVFKLGDKWVLVCISHRLGCRYFIGEFKDEQFLPQSHALLGGNSNRYFAPESLLTPDGRRVNWTWFFGGQLKGVQSLPTELALSAEGRLRIRPIRELESLRYSKQRMKNVTVKKDTSVILKKIEGQHLELKLVVKDPGAGSFGLDVLCDEQGKNGMRINVNREDNLLEVGSEKAPFKLKTGEALTLRIFIDTTLVEVFANERQIIMNDRPREANAKVNDGVALFSRGQDQKIDRIIAWKINSIYTKAPRALSTETSSTGAPE